MFKTEVQQKVQEHYDKLVSIGYNVVGVFLYGSQNYELDYEKSDVDTKAIVLPSLNDIVLNRQPVSTTIDIGDNNLCDVKDIRKMFECFKKQNINFIELLFTQYYVINPKYRLLYRPMLDNAEKIARYNNYASLNCMSGMALEKYNALTHPYPSIKDKIDKYGYDCYSENTLFLTDRGWKKYDDIVQDDKLATMNSIDLSLEFQPYTSRVKKITKDKIYEIESYDTKFSVTENHNIFTSRININKNGHGYKRNESEWVLQTLNKTISKRGTHKHIVVFPYNSNKEYDISDEWLKLCGLFLSDGTINFRDKAQFDVKALRLSQSKIHRDEFHILSDELLKHFGGSYNESSKKTCVECLWTFPSGIARDIYKECGHGSKNKQLPSFYLKLSKRQCNILLSSLLLGDRNFYKNRNVYYTSNLKMAREILTLSLMAGYQSVLMGGENGYLSDSPSEFGKVNMWHIVMKPRELQPSYINLKEGTNGNIKNIFNGEKTVVCFEVPNGLLVTMNNGKCATQGNCKQLHHILRLKDFITRYVTDEKYRSILIPTDREGLLKVKSTYFYSLEEAKKLAKDTCDFIKQFKDDYMQNSPVIVDNEVEELMTSVLTNIISSSIREEVNTNK